MTRWLRGSPEALRSLMTGVKGTQWSWRTDDVDELCLRMGWILNEVLEGEAASGEAGMGIADNELVMMFRDGRVEYLTIDVTQNLRDGGADRDRFIRDAFADAVDEGVSVLGEPGARQQTEPPTVRWRLDEDSTILVKNLETTVTLTWASNRFQDEWDRITEALA
ncbi:DUF6301 family protein [Actinoplanes missouriensis]|uniref:DUF6301 family protein n=1 Tax=Actinoplanes missouriensis TaxID=1866 RepID=UPI0034091F2D